MVIIEYQFCNTKHDCDTDSGCNTPVREYNLPEEQRESWIDFFEWVLVFGAEPRISGFEIRN
jgi:hypothetical protein